MGGFCTWLYNFKKINYIIFTCVHIINLYDWFSPTAWILGLNSRLLDLAASTFTTEPSPWTLLSNLKILSASLSSHTEQEFT